MNYSLIEIMKEGITSLSNNTELINLFLACISAIGIAFIRSIREFFIVKCKLLVSKFEKKKPHQLTVDYAYTYDSIKEIIAPLRRICEADRVVIYQFHNGEEFLLSKPLFKLTCSYESVSKGITFESEAVKRINITEAMEFISPLMDNLRCTPGVKDMMTCKKCTNNNTCSVFKDPIRILKYDVGDMPYSPFTRLMGSQGTTTIYSTLLYAEDRNHPIGILAIQYLDDLSHDNVIKRHTCEICQSAASIQYILDSNA